jgi:hypothetical protein
MLRLTDFMHPNDITMVENNLFKPTDNCKNTAMAIDDIAWQRGRAQQGSGL